jgi:glyoxylase-like metal-dependent hydrolase (beta-lactamase superfamily II)
LKPVCMSRQVLKIHGRGNAWPVLLGQEHPFYKREDYRDLANASYSLRMKDGKGREVELLVDAGQGTIQSLLGDRNQIPQGICLTHGHMDHILGVDWVVQSHRRGMEEAAPYPLYAPAPVQEALLNNYPYLEEHISFLPLSPGTPRPLSTLTGQARLEEAQLTAYPVYHGSYARGASMLLFRLGRKRVLFTGDLITPLLRNRDREALRGADLVVVDCNNRFSWPRTNHWSFAGLPDHPLDRSPQLMDYLEHIKPGDFIQPHLGEEARTKAKAFMDGEAPTKAKAFMDGEAPTKSKAFMDGEAPIRAYLDELAADWARDPQWQEQPFSILEFCRLYQPRKVILVHYSGAEDVKHHGQPQLSAPQLEEWAQVVAHEAGISSTFKVPATGEEVLL